MATTQFRYLVEGLRLFCVAERPQFMPVGSFGIVRHDELRCKIDGERKALTVLEFASCRSLKICFERLRDLGYDSGVPATVEEIAAIAVAAPAQAAEAAAAAAQARAEAAAARAAKTPQPEAAASAK